jgi:hypothetical protein
VQTMPEVGQLAIVRKRPFVVTEIIASAPGMAEEAAESNHLIKLSSVEDDGLGEELQVIWELEPGTAVHQKSTLPGRDSFDDPKRLQAFLDAVRWGAVSQEPSIKAVPPQQCSGFGATPWAGAVECDGPPQNAPPRASTSEPGICG